MATRSEVARSAGSVDASDVSRGVARNCVVCGSAAGETLFDNRMAACAGYDFSAPIRRCARCGAAFAGAALGAADLNRYYSQFSKYDTLGSRGDVSAIDRERIERALDFMGPTLGSYACALDVGCSAGAFLHALRGAGIQAVSGIDPAADASVKARELFGVAVQQAQAEEFTDYGKHDLICLMAVLEHLREPMTWLTHIGRQMRRGAHLLVEVPDAGAFDRPGDPRPFEAYGEFSNEHLNFFAIADIERLGRAAGFEVERWRTVRLAGGGPDLFVLLRRTAEPRTLHASDAGSDASRPDSESSMQSYIARSRLALQEVERRVAVHCRAPLLIYGAGNHTARMLAQLACLARAEVLAVLDRNPHLQGQVIGGIPILAPERIGDFAGVPVLISTMNARHEIYAALSRVTAQPLVRLYD
jgi:SAM-dependent methyltransferase